MPDTPLADIHTCIRAQYFNAVKGHVQTGAARSLLYA